MSANRVPVGVGAIVVRDGCLLMGLRKGSVGAGTWALPGGWLEPGESFETCAKRELEEETGITEVLPGSEILPFVSNNYGPAMDGQSSVTIFIALRLTGKPEPKLMEPHKCEQWIWHDLSTPLPQPLFPPFIAFTQSDAFQSSVLHRPN